MTARRHLIGLVLLIQTQTVVARVATKDISDEETVIAACIAKASEGKPWLEKTLWGIRDQEAGWIGAEILNRNGSHDLGPMQINSQWVDRLSIQLKRSPGLIRHWLIRNPCFNVDVARWIFLAGLAATNDYWRAIGIYHSPSSAKQNQYARSVAQKLIERFGPNVVPVGTAR